MKDRELEDTSGMNQKIQQESLPWINLNITKPILGFTMALKPTMFFKAVLAYLEPN